MHGRLNASFEDVQAVALPVLAVACGDDEDSADDSSPTTTQPLEVCSEVYTAGEGAPASIATLIRPCRRPC